MSIEVGLKQKGDTNDDNEQWKNKIPNRFRERFLKKLKKKNWWIGCLPLEIEL